jgi:hypothetical protein
MSAGEEPMADVNDQIRTRIESFVQELSELVRRAALESISSALGTSVGSPAAGRARGRRAAPAAASRGGRAGGGGGGGGKRSAEQLEGMTSALIGYVGQNPGQGVEQIARELQVSSKELVLPIRKLVASGQLATEGQKRATKYFVGDGSSEDGRGRRSKKKTRKAGRRS